MGQKRKVEHQKVAEEHGGKGVEYPRERKESWLWVDERGRKIWSDQEARHANNVIKKARLRKNVRYKENISNVIKKAHKIIRKTGRSQGQGKNKLESIDHTHCRSGTVTPRSLDADGLHPPTQILILTATQVTNYYSSIYYYDLRSY